MGFIPLLHSWLSYAKSLMGSFRKRFPCISINIKNPTDFYNSIDFYYKLGDVPALRPGELYTSRLYCYT